MFRLLNKKSFSKLLATLSLVVVNFSLSAQDQGYTYEPYAYQDCCNDPCGCNSVYIGAFGGVASPGNNTHLTQLGTAFFTEAQGGPLAVDARGDSNKKTSGLWGLQLGYEWNNSCLLGCITPAVELEAFFFKNTKEGLVDSSISPDRLPEHHFRDTIPTYNNIYLINGVFTLNRCCWGRFSPYIGAGIGLAKVTIRDAISEQVTPPELGVNHFNSKPNDSAWTLAAQAKLGLRYHLCGGLRLFGEYRLSYLDTSRFILGSTAYSTHAPTSPWNVDLKGTYYNAFVLGLQYDFGG